MDPAIIGATAALAGSGMTFFAQFLIDGRKANRDREAEIRRDTRELQTSARLVMEELAEALALIEDAARTRRFWKTPRQIPTETWNTYRTSLAACIASPDGWFRITTAYDAVNNLNWIVQHRRDTNQTVAGWQEGVSVEAADETRHVWLLVLDAIEALETALSVPAPASRANRVRREAQHVLWPYGDGADFDIEAATAADELQHQERPELES